MKNRTQELNEALNPDARVNLNEISIKNIVTGILFAPLAIIAGLAMSAGIVTAGAFGSFGLLGVGQGNPELNMWDKFKKKLAKRAMSKKYSDDDIAKMYDILTKNSPQMVKRLTTNWGKDAVIMRKIASKEGIEGWDKLESIIERLREHTKGKNEQ